MAYNEIISRIEDWRLAGKIAAQALEYGRSLIRPGASFLEASERIEARILELGGEIAFPVQMSFDHVAAHSCAEPGDETLFEKQLVCLDVGVHVNGAIGDNACTVDLSGANTGLVKASEEALKKAGNALGIGVRVSEIGRIIAETIREHGFVPVHNLSGHGLDYYNIHSPPRIPNFDTKEEAALEKGMVVAIEPFASAGAGMIYESDSANIFAFSQKRPVRSAAARELLREIEGYRGLPFTTRWLTKKHPAFKVNFGLKELLRAGAIRKYPPLPDKGRGLVSQAEKTFLIDDKVELLTRA